MERACLPANETQRLQALLDTCLLDSAKEERFDRLTRLTQQVLQVPMVLITLVDAERQWVKSCQGIALQEAPRAGSFCSHTIVAQDMLEVSDTLQDPRFAGSCLVTQPPHIRFYAGAPLRTQEGHCIGTLCVLADQARQLSAQERAVLRSLADCVEAEIHATHLLHQRQALEMSQKLGEVIRHAQSHFIRADCQHHAFDSMLQGLLQLTGSTHGFIAELSQSDDGHRFLNPHAVTHIGTDAQPGARHATPAPGAWELNYLPALFTQVLHTHAPAIDNSPTGGQSLTAVSAGDAPLNALLGMPVCHAGEMLAMFGLFNRPGGYNAQLLEYLQPLAATIAQLVIATRNRLQQQPSEIALSRLSRVASETTNGVVITDAQGKVQWINEGFTRMTGYQLQDLLGKNPSTVPQGAEHDAHTLQLMRDALAHGESFEIKILKHLSDATPYWVRIGCSPLRNAQGLLEGFLAIQTDITEQKRVEQQLRQFQDTLNQTMDCVFMFDAQTLRFFYVNEGGLRQVGYDRAEMSAMHPYDIKPDYPEQRFREALRPLVEGQVDVFTFLTNHRHKNGQLVPVESLVQYVTPANQRPHFVAIVRDISERKRIEQTLIEQAQYTQTIIDQMVDGLITIDTRGDVQSFNPAAQRIFGYEASEVVGRNVSMLLPEPHQLQHDHYLQQFQQGGLGHIMGVGREMEGRRKDGSLFPLEIAISQITHQGKVQYVGLVNDITERKRNEAQLRYLATHDALTSLPNRTLFMDRLVQGIAETQSENRLIAVLLLDLDNFKVVNDSFGHHQGDELLVELSTRLGRTVRAGDTVARLGGDEYAVILTAMADEAQVHEAAERLLQVTSEPLMVQGQEFTPSASIGYSICPTDAGDAATLLRHADAAMYAAKAAGRAAVMGYRAEMNAVSSEHMHILARLRAAIENGAFQLFYQPQVHTATGRILGAEALLRWDDPELGSVSPGRFIPVAESSGLILPLGDWVLETACKQIAAWHAMGIALPISINLSLYQFRQEDLVEKIKSACQRHQCPAHLLELEITESAAMQSPELTNQQLTMLASAGFSLALDDFGTGYSSLARLGQLRVHKLKIDRSFIVETPGNPMYETLVRTTIGLGNELGMQVVAEGVETEAQRAFLQSHGCAAYQGWLFSKAVPATAFLALVNASTTASALA